VNGGRALAVTIRQPHRCGTALDGDAWVLRDSVRGLIRESNEVRWRVTNIKSWREVDIWYIGMIAFFAVSLVTADAHAQVTQSAVSTVSAESESREHPRPQTHVDDNGYCVVDNASLSDDVARQACTDLLIPRRPVLSLQTPGAFFVGYAWGTKSSQFVYGPQVGIGGAVVFPLVRPSLIFQEGPSGDHGQTFSLPDQFSFTLDLAASLNANLGSFTIPNAPGSSGMMPTSSPPPPAASGTTQQAFNASIYIAPQIGGVWWDDGRERRVGLSLGLVAGYINTDATGAGFVLGFQPALVAQF
jgi:hypothetical protein